MSEPRTLPPRRVRRFLVGATASGKTAVGFALARIAPAELVSMDSMLVYRGLDVLTAKPSAAERAACPLHATDLVDASGSFSVARYLEVAEAAEREIESRGRAPVFVGGTALYLKALTHGLFEGPPSDPELRRELTERAEREGAEALHGELQRIDPSAASRIHPRDRKRVIRALEVFTATGEKISELQREWTLSAGFPRIAVGLRVPREELARRIGERVDRMLAAGLVDEVRAARERGLSREAREAVGVKEAEAVLEGRLDFASARAEIVRRTRELARRQATWFRSFPEIVWVDADETRTPDAIALDVRRTLELAPP
ncbi:MAG TPA: tRNA (adenosine(37)-N6)-dimethylallyltransferase MiaA [Planctomycetota bacterium]|nr:tRNA (adenosine(37)-N6)-dimethylallyltransferase MiaA [Planctomycetota bacterium]